MERRQRPSSVGGAGAGLFGGEPLNDINAQIDAIVRGHNADEQNLDQRMLRGEI